MRAYALVELGDPESIDLFLQGEDAWGTREIPHKAAKSGREKGVNPDTSSSCPAAGGMRRSPHLAVPMTHRLEIAALGGNRA